MTTTSAVERFDPSSDSLAQERFGVLADIRENSPVAFVPSIGMWAVTGYEALREVLADPVRFPSGAGYRAPDHLPAEAFAVYPADGPLWSYALIGTDGDLHRRLRSPITRAFTARRVKAVEPLIAGDAEGLLRGMFDGRDDGDLYAEFARPLPSRTICRFFGLPVQEAPRFSAWSGAFVTLQVPGLPAQAHVQAAQQFADFDAYVRQIVTGDLSGIGEGIIRHLVEGSRAHSHDLTEDEMVGDIANVLFAGHETTVSTLSNMLVRLLGDRELWRSVADGSADLPLVVEELLRLDTSVIGLFRYTAADTTLAGVDIPAGSALWVAFGATNRDPAAFDDPDTFRPGRSRGYGPLTFGHGVHVCVGKALAAVQLQLALAAVPRVWPTLALDGPIVEVPNHLLRITPAIPVRR